VRALSDRATARQVRRLLEPAAEGHAAAAEPGVQIRDAVRTIQRVQQRIRHRIRPAEVLAPAQHAADRVVGRQRFERGAEFPQVRFGGGDAEHAAVLLHHVDAGTAVRRVDHQVHGALRAKHIAERTQTDIGIREVMQHPGAHNLIERAPEGLDVLDRELPDVEIVEVMAAL
jgi:hypothetical protein